MTDQFFKPELIVLPDDIGERAAAVGALTPMPNSSPPETSANGSQPAGRQPVTVVPLQHFASQTELTAAPLIGTPDDSLLPADGLLLMYGDGGAGKTTLSIDAACHLAAGSQWLGITVPAPIRIMLIENEGPRGPFRRRLASKLEHWQGDPFHHNIVVLEEPWTRFTLTDKEYRQQLAQAISDHQTELLIVGPLASLGAKGTGTPDEINEFDLHIKDLRAHAHRPFAIWIVHHENKQGDVSGAWERYPDSLVHVQSQGNGHTKIVWRKVRWSSSLHGTNTNLAWADGHTFTLVDKPDRDLRAEVLTWLQGRDYMTLAELSSKEQGIGANKDKVRPILSRLTEDGQLEYAQGRRAGRSNANAKCWRLKLEPLTLTSTGSDPPSQYEPVGQSAVLEPSTGSLARPYSETVESQLVGEYRATGSTNPSQYHLDEAGFEIEENE